MTEQAWDQLVTAHADASRGPLAELPEHRPIAAVLACSDARVPPSVVFDQPAGSLFVVRIAGNVPTEGGLASLDYAVDQLGVDLVVVLGHTGCGAVQAAAAGTCGGVLLPIVEPICKIAHDHPGADFEQLVELNVLETMGALARHAGPVGISVRSGDLALRGAVHDLQSGTLRHVAAPEVVPAR